MLLQTFSHIDAATILGMTSLAGSFLFSLTRLALALRKKARS